ncbi:hypothetical protein [Bradyrhizobium sp.]|jgi:hypothetical protein|uniref:hypothetical protein n=1 Tax=Bradyrhizobium sp. TaxID=376 RepID=UPI002DDD85BC|nr:hypothetical protein [Bradyrhizobium sp.]HEV2154357.1 hypothetical protein [Bradyrhizobium sp.]
MTMQMSRRGQEYLETAQSLLRAARTMTDAAVAARLEMLANDYQRRAEKASTVDAARSSSRSTGAGYEGHL